MSLDCIGPVSWVCQSGYTPNLATLHLHTTGHEIAKSRKLLKINQFMVPGGGADCRFILILNKLLKTLDAQNYQNAGNAVLKYTIRTRDFRPMDSALGRIDCRRGSSLPDLRGS